MRPPAAVLGLGLLAAGIAAGWALRPGGATRDDVAALRTELDELREERRAAEAELAEARSDERDAARARREAASVPAPAEPSADEPAVTEAPTDDWRGRVAAYPAYPMTEAGPEVRDALTGVDWLVVADNLSAMVPVGAEIAAALARGESPAAETIGSAQEHNGPLLAIAMRLQANGVPGTGVNGAFTHPAFVTNAIAACLEAQGLPLTAQQHERLGRIGAEHARLERERWAGYTDDTPPLRALVAGADLKRAFLDAAFGALTVAQHDALAPPGIRGRVALDAFSEGLLWVGRALPIVYRDQAHLAELVEARLLPDLDGDAHERARSIVQRWVAELPPEIRDHDPDALDRMGMIDASHVTACARQVLALVDMLRREGDLDESAVKRLRGLEGTVVPFRAATE